MRIEFGILAVPSRKELTETLVGSLQAGMSECQPVTVSYDYEGRGCGWNTMNVMDMLDSKAEVAFVLQDDVVVCRNFARAVHQSLPYLYASKGLVAASYFANTNKVLKAQSAHRWIKYPLRAWVNWLWTYAYAVPMPVAKQFVAWYKAHDAAQDWVPEAYENTSAVRHKRMVADNVFTAFLCEAHVDAYVTTHTLAQHMGGVSSLLGHRFDPATGKNYSPYFIGEDADGLAYDWSKV